jgi:hypothetical protein
MEIIKVERIRVNPVISVFASKFEFPSTLTQTGIYNELIIPYTKAPFSLHLIGNGSQKSGTGRKSFNSNGIKGK